MSLVAFRIQCSFHLLLLSLKYHYCEESIIWSAPDGAGKLSKFMIVAELLNKFVVLFCQSS